MVICPDATRWSNGLYQLPDAIFACGFIFLWHWLRHVWETAALRNILCSPWHLDSSNCVESYLAAIFSFWSAGMDVAQFDVLEEATIQEITEFGNFIEVKSTAIYIVREIFHMEFGR